MGQEREGGYANLPKQWKQSPSADAAVVLPIPAKDHNEDREGEVVYEHVH